MLPLPVPLNALRAFEAAARHLSIKQAALELGVTPSAVSHQLRVLEDGLGLELLRREGAGLVLTSAGRSLSPELTSAFERITGAVTALRAPRKIGPLRLTVLPTFATHWLSPRLASYPFDRRGTELQITTTQDMVDLAAGTADAGIRSGRGDWPGLVSDRLFAETLTLLGAPVLAAPDDAALRRALGGTNLFLSHHRRAEFEAWNAALPGGPVTPAAITIVDSVGFCLTAAMDGAGITLAGLEIAADDLRAGRLHSLFDHRLTTGAGYYLVYPPVLSADRRLRSLRTWLLAQAARASARASGQASAPAQDATAAPSHGRAVAPAPG
ncbi:LysR family glycine cleavage system transcriptional activator [Rhodoligotrophos appendicifer]|uniref:LysR substrate-binding domain-containing protein n=1 Tax=Rhodoligotrophos appendicifer TaxID=987056 RepID=UPI0011846D39|nr:LysR substrate-binding domain-containing protein [Rhodoligotrophos appendicifer]